MKNELFKRVKLLMETMHDLRDCDIKLFQAIRREDCYNHGYLFNNLNGREIEILERQKIISNRDTITRYRREIEEEHVNLRGATWAARQLKGGEIRKERALSKSGGENHKNFSDKNYKDWKESGVGTFFEYLDGLFW